MNIPNSVDATYPAQAAPDSRDFDILSAGYANTCVSYGCAVTAQGSPDMTVAVAAGGVQVSGAPAAVTAGNVTITTADATNDRIDLVVVNASGTKSVTAGTAAANPVFPTIPASSVVLAAVYVSANATTITSGRIIDKRIIGGVPAMVSDHYLKPTAALFETYSRRLGAQNISALTSGTPKLVGVALPAGLVVTSITWFSATTALSSAQHAWAALYDSSLNLLRQSTDDTSAVWAANSSHTFTLSSTFTTTYTGFHYVGLMVAASGAVPTLAAHSQGSALSNLYALTPVLVGNSSSTGQTATSANPVGALTASITLPYAYVS